MNQQERDEYLEIGWTGPGWESLIKELDNKLSEIDPDYTIEDKIKEKFVDSGTILYSDSENTEKMYELEYEYERKS